MNKEGLAGFATCLNPNCDARRYARGLCNSCYNSARRLVLSKQTTWETLQAAGKCLTSRTPKGKSTIRWLLSSSNALGDVSRNETKRNETERKEK